MIGPGCWNAATFWFGADGLPVPLGVEPAPLLPVPLLPAPLPFPLPFPFPFPLSFGRWPPKFGRWPPRFRRCPPPPPGPAQPFASGVDNPMLVAVMPFAVLPVPVARTHDPTVIADASADTVFV